MALSTLDIESRVDANQRLVSFGAVTGSLMLALQHITIEAHAPSWLNVLVTLASSAGWIVFLYAAYKNRKLFMTAEGLEYKKQIEGDERLMTIRNQAFMWGFGAMLVIQVVMILAWTFFELHFLTIPVSTTATMAAGITSAVLRFQILSSK